MSESKRFVTITNKKRVVIQAGSRAEAVREFQERYGYDPGFGMEESSDE